MRLNPPRIPVISNRTGQPLTDAQATDPAYWVAHLRGTVDFAACMATLADPNRIFLEMGPGRALTSLAQANGIPAARLIPALRHPDQAMADDAWHMASLARLWACGAQVDWAQIWGDAPRRRLPLPTYPFQRQRNISSNRRPPHSKPRPPCARTTSRAGAGACTGVPPPRPLTATTSRPARPIPGSSSWTTKASAPPAPPG
jgi:acyl transferase domain-containing protein